MCSTREEAFERLATGEFTPDIIFVCSDGELVPTNSVALIARSDYFRTLLKGPFSEGSPRATREVTIGLVGAVLRPILQFLWTDKADILEDGDLHEDEGFACTIAALIEAAHLYNLENLCKKAIDVARGVLKKKPSDLAQYISMSGLVFEQLALPAIRSDPNILLQEKYLRVMDKSKMNVIVQDKWLEATEKTLFEILSAWSALSRDDDDRNKKEAKALVQHVSLARIHPFHLSKTVAESGLATTQQLFRAYKTQALLALGPEPFPHNLKESYNETRAPHCWFQGTEVMVWKAKGCASRCPGALLHTGIHKWSFEILKMDGNPCLGVEVPLHLEDCSEKCEYPYWFYDSTGRVVSRHKGTKVKGKEQYPKFRVGSVVSFELNLCQQGGTLRASVDDGPSVDLFANMLSKFDDSDSIGFVPAVRLEYYDEVKFLGYSDSKYGISFRNT